jgi:hypothetical protein
MISIKRKQAPPKKRLPLDRKDLFLTAGGKLSAKAFQSIQWFFEF